MSKLILINLSNTLKNELLQRKLIFTCLDVCIHVILLSILSSSLLTLFPIFIYMLCQTNSNWVSQTNRSSKKVIFVIFSLGWTLLSCILYVLITCFSYSLFTCIAKLFVYLFPDQHVSSFRMETILIFFSFTSI